MTTGSFIRTDLNDLHYVVQNTQAQIVKDIILSVLRDEFSKDAFYRYVKNEFGFPKTPDLTNKSLNSGYDNDDSTRIFIGERYRHDTIYYPAILIRMGSVSYVPISINRNKETVKYSATKVIDEFGNEKVYTTPTHFVFAGAWEGTVSLDIHTRDIESRDELTSICSLMMQDIRYEELLRAGIAVRKVSSSGPSEDKDRDQETLYKDSVNLEIRTEYRREIPVQNTLDAINFCIEFGHFNGDQEVIAHNLTIGTQISILDVLDEL